MLVPIVDLSEVTLPADEAHHIAQVLRMDVGDAVIIFDGRGAEWHARLASVDKRAVRAEILQPRTPAPEPYTHVTLAIGLLKGDAMDDVVRDGTALGVTEFLPMQTDHCVVPRKARGDEAMARWERVAVASAKQCGRATLPTFRPVTPYREAIVTPAELHVICVEPILADGADWPMLEHPAAPRSAVVLVGPEGGWSRAEVEHARGAGYQPWRLGDFTLRAALAPSVALSQLWARFSASGADRPPRATS